jgi:hypothetical protein
MSADKITRELLARGYIRPRRHHMTETARYQKHRNGKPVIEWRQEYELHGIYWKPGLLQMVRALKGVGRPFRSLVRWQRSNEGVAAHVAA